MPCAGRSHRLAALVFVALAALAAVVRAQPALDALIFRVFLRDGSTLVSYGDFARVADRVVLSIPLGSIDGPSPPLHLVSIAEAAVDWERTDRYSQAIRARHYAATQGEVDFEALSADVAKALNDVATISAPSERLAVVTAARRRLADWPAAHHGYRANDVAQLATLLDDAIADLRVAAGLSRIDLTLVATAAPLAPDVPELPAPSEREAFDQALAAASAAADTSERVSLLEAIAFSLGGPAGTAGALNGNRGAAGAPLGGTRAEWSSSMHARASAALSSETKIDQDYRTLAERMIGRADERARRADVAGIESLLRAVLEADDKLGRKRPEMTASLLATLDGRLDAARRLRLARDTWTARRDGLNRYQRGIRAAVDRFRRSIPALEQIRQLSGPSPAALMPLSIRLNEALRELNKVSVPAEAHAIQGMLTNASQTAIRAVASRRIAIASGDMATAWEASSAAAGALLMFERAQDELRKLNSPPGQ
jgi:hypothetical protein